MPIITVKMGKGRTVEQKRELVRALTKVAVETLNAEPEWVTVLIEEYESDRGNWAVGGELLIDRFAAGRGEEGAVLRGGAHSGADQPADAADFRGLEGEVGGGRGRRRMTIRRLRRGDEDAAVRVVEDLKFKGDGVVGVSVDPAYMRTFLSDDRHYFIVAYIGKKPVGYVFAYRLQRFDGRRPQVLLYEIGVAEEHRRKGIGRALVEGLKEMAKADGCGKMFVPTSRSNEAAMALYRAAGGEEGGADATGFWWGR